MYLLLLALSFFTFTSRGWAGGTNSGGGYVVACTKDGKTTYEFLDFYEAGKKKAPKFKLDALPEGTDPYEIAKGVVDRISTFSPYFAKEWKQTIDDFKSFDMSLVEDADINDIQDAEMLFTPKAPCKVVQAAVQVKEPKEDEYRLYVDETIWNGMDLATKAGLLVHEAIYKTAMAQGQEKSINFRPLTGLLFSTALKEKEDYEILKYFKQAKLQGCFDKNIEMERVGEDASEVGPLRLTIDLKIESYEQDDFENFRGEYCGKNTVSRSFDNNFTMILYRDTQVKYETGQICFENPQDSGDRRIAAYRGTESYQDKFCFMNKKDYLTDARTINVKPKITGVPSLNFQSCSDAIFVNRDVIICENAVGDFTLEGQKINFRSYWNSITAADPNEYMLYNADAANYEMSLGSSQITILGKVLMDQNKNIYTQAVNRDQSLSVNGVTCNLQAMHTIVFSAEGKFQSVKRPIGRCTPHNDRVLVEDDTDGCAPNTADSCAVLLP